MACMPKEYPRETGERGAPDDDPAPTANRPALPVEAGMCGDCRYASVKTTRRSTTYLRCTRAAWDDRLPKYPRLPVFSCAGFASEQGLSLAGLPHHNVLAGFAECVRRAARRNARQDGGELEQCGGAGTARSRCLRQMRTFPEVGVVHVVLQ
jgi:hypothetical protein